MRRSVSIGYVVAYARRQGVRDAMLMLDGKLARDNEDDMAFVTPVVSNVICAVFDEAKLDIAKLAHAHSRATRFARMYGRWKVRPIRDAERQIVEIHVVILRFL
jgi:hypothetical protein